MSQKVGDFEVDRGEHIGAGSFGTVYIAIHSHTKQKVAAKEILIKEQTTAETIEREIKVHQSIPKHENIVDFIAYEKKSKSFWIFTWYCELGDLNAYHQNADPCMTLSEKIVILKQVCQGIQHLHSQEPPVAHRDLKPANVLITEVDGKIIAKICDLGIAKETQRERYHQTNVGTYPYKAPEFFQSTGSEKRKYDISVDIFSLGLLISSFIDAEEFDELPIPKCK